MQTRPTWLVSWVVGRSIFSSSCALRRWRTVGEPLGSSFFFFCESFSRRRYYNVNTRQQQQQQAAAEAAAAAAALWKESCFSFSLLELFRHCCSQSHPEMPTMLLLLRLLPVLGAKGRELLSVPCVSGAALFHCRRKRNPLSAQRNQPCNVDGTG